MPRIIFTLTDEMESDLKEEAAKRGMPVASLLRQYIARGLVQDTGKPAERYNVKWGGDRTPDDENDE